MFKRTQEFPLSPEYAPRLTVGVRRFLEIKGYKTQGIPSSHSSVTQAKKISILRDLVGFSSAFTIRIWHDTSTVKVETVSERWEVRLVVVAVGLFAPPLFLVPLIGGYLQFKNIDELWQDINELAVKMLAGQ